MKMSYIRWCAAGFVFVAAGCAPDDPKDYTRIHLQNDSDQAVTFLAIEKTEQALLDAENRLLKPLPPSSVYSAVVSRPGNYWLRTEVDTDGYTIERIEGPVRLGRGVVNWEFQKVDSHPLYGNAAGRDTLAYHAPVLAGAVVSP